MMATGKQRAEIKMLKREMANWVRRRVVTRVVMYKLDEDRSFKTPEQRQQQQGASSASEELK